MGFQNNQNDFGSQSVTFFMKFVSPKWFHEVPEEEVLNLHGFCLSSCLSWGTSCEHFPNCKRGLFEKMSDTIITSYQVHWEQFLIIMIMPCSYLDCSLASNLINIAFMLLNTLIVLHRIAVSKVFISNQTCTLTSNHTLPKYHWNYTNVLQSWNRYVPHIIRANSLDCCDYCCVLFFYCTDLFKESQNGSYNLIERRSLNWILRSLTLWAIILDRSGAKRPPWLLLLSHCFHQADPFARIVLQCYCPSCATTERIIPPC